MSLIKELEVRRANGNFVTSFQGEFGHSVLLVVSMLPELKKETRSIKGKGEFIVFECIKDCGYTFGGMVQLLFFKGDYIKIVQ